LVDQTHLSHWIPIAWSVACVPGRLVAAHQKAP
jgi:hypothetical protein